MQLYERKLSHFFAKSLFSLIAWTPVGDAKAMQQPIVFVICFCFCTERGIAPIAQVLFWRRFRKQASANSLCYPPVRFPLRDLRTERRDQPSTSSLLPSRPREFHPEPLTDPDLTLSHHPARAIDRRLPPSVGCQAPPVASWPDPTSMTCPLRSTSITPASSLLRGSPPLSGASVLSASRLEPLVPFPLASPVRFSRSVQKPGRASRRLHAGCRSAGIRTSAELIPKEGSPLGSDIT